MPKDRRKNAAEAREKLDEQLQRTGDEADDRSSDAGHSDDESGFVPITQQQKEEVNELFDIIHAEGYMAHGVYSAQFDGDRASVTLNVILPSSPGTPGTPPIPDSDSEGDPDE